MKPITTSDIPEKFKAILESKPGLLDEYLFEANKQDCFWRRKANEQKDFYTFLVYSFHFADTKKGLFGWIDIAEQF